MPTMVALVDGVKIQFYANEHPPPHFHAEFAEHRGVIDIESLSADSLRRDCERQAEVHRLMTA